MEFLYLLLLLLVYVVPVGLTLINLFNLFAPKPRWEEGADRLTFALGPLLTLILCNFWDMPDWEAPVVMGGGVSAELHAFLDSRHLPTILALALCALAGYLILRLSKEGALPPLPTVLCIAGVEIGLVLSAVVLVQLSSGLLRQGILPLDGLYMALFPFNYILCALRLLRRVTAAQVERFLETPPARPLPAFYCRVLSHSMGWVLAAFLLALPLLALLLGALVLLGQAPNAAVRVFTDTSDWFFSQKISPPPIEYQGHYLCTVAAGGHPKLVKPTRYGVRYGQKIVVNRQLCVANAFEQLLQERVPRFHRAVRRFYDEHGYPLSKKITTPLRSDVTYLLMKPLEWAFLLVLYTFDSHPENRIAMQYTGK